MKRLINKDINNFITNLTPNVYVFFDVSIRIYTELSYDIENIVK